MSYRDTLFRLKVRFEGETRRAKLKTETILFVKISLSFKNEILKHCSNENTYVQMQGKYNNINR